jgi:hypothetical protein
MAGLGEQINIIDEGGMLAGAPIVGVDDDGAAPAQVNGPMHWTPVLSSFMLRRFHDLVGQGVKTDKGFKEVHVRQVATMLSDFAQVNVTTQQIYNHLRKWRQRWVKIKRLKDLSGALWSEEYHMIVLDDEHLNGHTKVRYLVVSTLVPCLSYANLCLIVKYVSLPRIILVMQSS